MKERVTKGWFVEGVLDDDDAHPVTGALIPRRLSRVFQVYDAAAAFAALTKRQVRHPELVNVRTVTGYDDAKGLCG